MGSIHILLFLKNSFTYLFMAVLGLHCCEGFSLAAARRDCSLVAEHGLLLVVPSLVSEHRLRSTGSLDETHGL